MSMEDFAKTLTEEQRQRIVEQSLSVDIPEQLSNVTWQTSRNGEGHLTQQDKYEHPLAECPTFSRHERSEVVCKELKMNV